MTLGIAGAVSSVISADVGAIVSTLGGIGLARETVDSFANIIKPPDEARDDDFYFLWKLTK